MPDLISYKTILAAKAGDGESLTAILHHYSSYISAFSKRTVFDEYGNRYDLVNDDIRQRIEAKLMFQIVYKFDPTKLPE